ncbi:site-specific recombinase, phage integrase family [Paenibacillus sp. oral taxon 786 str. D14]|uniref:tyrosine-type recombinase/integrase n=1 Tax=Paenibacillus sp. oral taxon 786 TaxID=652715 RepID=UPI0001AFD546|nr:tyrosine-type recombinase/integrase [Paenibacillus sp. oral taxon 786]EES71199.1 site-specific recombinase, phage integrase family [Paenibacillus sp. oral taxon 786 str. D14]
MSGNVVRLLRQNETVSKRRSNKLFDAGSATGAGYRLTWEEAVNLFIQARRAETSSDDTIKFERNSLKCYQRILEEQDIEPDIYDISIDLLRNKFVMFMVEKKGYKLNTINNRIKAIKRFFTFLHEEGWIPDNPAAHLKTRKGHQPTIPSFTEEQVVALFKQPDQNTFTGFRDFVMLSLILDTGLRVGEMIKLKTSQVDIKDSQLLGVIGKSKKPRDIPFCDDVRKLLIRYIKARGDVPSQYFFVTLHGRQLGVRTFQDTLHQYGKDAGITNVRVSPHTLRHTFAKMYILQDGDPYSLQDILGHTSQDMVKKYVNLWRPEMKSKHEKSSPMRHLYKERLL